MALPLKYSLRALWVRRRTSVAAAAGVALVVFVLASSQMLATGLQRTLLDAGAEDKAIVLQTDTFSESGSRLRQSVLGIVASAPGVRKSTDGSPLVVGEAVTHVYLSHANDDAQQASIQIRGVSQRSFELRPTVSLIEGRHPQPGTDEAIAGKALVGQYQGIELGNGFDLRKNRRLAIVGVFEASGSAYESEVWTDLDVVRDSFNSQGFVSSITAQLDSAKAFDGFELTLEADKRQGLDAERERSYYRKVSNYLSSMISGIGAIVAFIFSFGAMLGAAITMSAAVSQRRREIGVLRALGFTPRAVLAAILLESCVLAIAGGTLGIAVALITPMLDFTTVNWATGQELVFRFVPSFEVLSLALLAGTAVGVIGGFVPAVGAARMNPTRAMRR